MQIVKKRARAKKSAVKLWMYFKDFSPPKGTPRKFREWNIIPSPDRQSITHEMARLQWTILSKESVA